MLGGSVSDSMCMWHYAHSTPQRCHGGWHDTLLPTYFNTTLLPTQAFLSSAANLYRANERVFTLLQALDVPTVYT